MVALGEGWARAPSVGTLDDHLNVVKPDLHLIIELVCVIEQLLVD